MSNVHGRCVPPSVKETAFNCPHCDALAQQHWHNGLAKPLGDGRSPTLITDQDVQRAAKRQSRSSKIDSGAIFSLSTLKKSATGRPFLDIAPRQEGKEIRNVFLSTCQNCTGMSLWIHDRLVWPNRRTAPIANNDLPPEIKVLYDEARAIADISPRGAAALLRLCVQLLCKHLGEASENINTDIAHLVAKGLDARVQMALDVVRVVGNNAVHPGHINLDDNREVANSLFGLINLIANIMITQPQHVATLYAGLPEDALSAIKQRDQDA